MKKTFDLADLSAKKPPAKPAKPVAAAYKPATPWAAEFLRRVDKLHKALDGQKLA